ncbi:DUF3108 domain-containing protein [Caldimonas sp. KR1-144]|uniref:DUF3108 domain-containing protein n=1 Tax=Caldimonas sp. KR1-144 TaxID=3400911 RepID=UPI003BFFCCC2
MTTRRRLRWTLALLALGVALAHLGLLGLGGERAAPQPTVAAPVVLAAVPVEPAPPAAAAPAAMPAVQPKPVPRRAPAQSPAPPMPREAPAPVRDDPPVAPIEPVSDDAARPTLAADLPVETAAADDAPPARLLPVAGGAMSPQASAALAEALASPPPVYRTRIPPAAKLTYRLTRSGFTGTGTLDWKPDGGSYTLRLEGKLPLLGTLITQVSRGGFDRAGLAPLRFTDKRISKSEQAANFQRGRGQISFSGPSWELPILAGTQDRLSVMVQLAAVAGAWTRAPATGEQVQAYVVGARGDGDVWTIRYLGREAVRTADGRIVDSLKFLREPTSPHGTRAEFWLDPGSGFLPVRARLTDGSGDALELLRDAGAS